MFKIPFFSSFAALTLGYTEQVYVFELAIEASVEASTLPVPLYQKLPFAVLVEIIHLIF